MEDKLFELMTNMYSEITAKLNTMDKKLDENRLDIVRLENKLDNNSKALFDGYKQTFDKLMEIDN